MVKLFCSVVGVAGSAFPVNIDERESVGDLKEVIKAKQPETITVKQADKLKLFLAKKTDGTWLDGAGVAAMTLDGDGHPQGFQQMNSTLWINNEKHFGKSFRPAEGDVHVLVVAPKIDSKRPADDELIAAVKRTKTDEFAKLSVKKDEFQLDSLTATQESATPAVRTPDLYKFWQGFGGFPPYYFVRKEEVVFWEVIKKFKSTMTERRIVIVGSPGVGKSCFLLLIAFYLACVEKREVLVIRCLKESERANAVVYLNGDGKYARLTDALPKHIYAMRRQFPKAIVLVDGYRQRELTVPSQLVPFHFLATSCQFDVRQDDQSRLVVLPAWHKADLLTYAQQTNWVIDTGLRKILHSVKDKTVPILVEEQYYYSGGSLREFCRTRDELQSRVVDDCAAVKSDQANELMCTYGGGKSQNQVDRLRRHYIDDCTKEEHYRRRIHWTLSVDSGYALKLLGKNVSMEKQLEIYTYAKSIGAGFHGVVFEVLLHSAVQYRKPVVLKMREGAKVRKRASPA